jgi:hypothetical protein
MEKEKNAGAGQIRNFAHQIAILRMTPREIRAVQQSHKYVENYDDDTFLLRSSFSCTTLYILDVLMSAVRLMSLFKKKRRDEGKY